jgi:Ca2+-binding RTX toxin-like protein
MAVIKGTYAGETLLGGSGADQIRGLGGDDSLYGNGGDDILMGGAGADLLDGGSGYDFASYADAEKAVTASLGAPATNTGGAKGDTYYSIEWLEGSRYDDVLTGDSDDNTLRGGAGADKLDGGAGFDFASFYTAAEGLTVSLATPSTNTGDASGDTFVSIEGLVGSTFNDVLTGDAGSNWLIGQGGADVLDGGAGFDFAAYVDATSGVSASLAAPLTNTGEAAGDTYISIEGLIGSAYADQLTGDSGDNWLIGGGGGDWLYGGAGLDYAAYVNATSGITASLAAPGTNTGEAAGDTYFYIEALAGSSYDDKLVGDNAGNWLHGGAGADILDGQDARDIASYWDSRTAVVASLASPGSNTGDAAGDIYISMEGLAGSQYDDMLIGDANNNWLVGQAGADALDGGSGIDTAAYLNSDSGLTASLAMPSTNTGEAAGDTYTSIESLYGSRHADRLIGDAGANQLDGDDGDDILTGGAGGDSLNGGSGNDFASYASAKSGVTASLAVPDINRGDARHDNYYSIEGLEGSRYKDVLTGNGNDNTLRGGASADKLDGGAGLDIACFYTAAAGLTVSLAMPSTNTGDAKGDTFISIEGLGGSTFDDVLTGDTGSNWLIGQGGADILDGGAGFDFAAYVDATSGVSASLAAPVTNTGEAAGDTYISIEGLIGSAYADQLTGDGGSDWLAGGGGGDRLDGGAGLDYAAYLNATRGITVSLAAPETNTGDAVGDVYISIEGLVGSAYGDELTGDSGDNWLIGGGGGDWLYGGAGLDYAAYVNATSGITVSLREWGTNTGEAAGDRYVGIEALAGSSYDDKLEGNAAGNWLHGGAGADILNGQGADDIASYWDAHTAVVASLASPGSNTGDAAGDIYISIEGLAGSQYDDTLSGDANNNWLVGQAGADALDGGSGNDTAAYLNSDSGLTASLAMPSDNTGEAAGDTYTSIENLSGTRHADRLIGDAGANRLDGDDGDDILTGGAGGDSLNGGSGNDFASYADAQTAVTASLAAPVTNRGDAKADTYFSIEGLEGSRYADILTGDGSANSLEGGDANDRLNGGDGNDVLVGGDGKDVLTGGAGADQFLFDVAPNAASNLDTIRDFNVADDTIVLDRSVFTAFGAAGAIDAGAFSIGSKALDADDHIIYNQATGGLFYDSNGSAAGGSVQIAKLSAGLPLTFEDFFIV